ncbi:MAG: hypothetical protein JW927_16575 [Deltaproteobacteria bacterium]|nr:hypothetical protein [Deltaproteobacteria bacterium]
MEKIVIADTDVIIDYFSDILIAGICITHDIPIITRNTAHFSRIARLQIFSY